MHRYVYKLKDPSLLPSEVVRHSCHTPNCINPEHLFKGTQKDNWKDSEALHRQKAKSRRKKWSINGVVYETLRDASKITGIHQSTIIKHTYDGVFNISDYVEACVIANVTPKIK